MDCKACNKEKKYTRVRFLEVWYSTYEVRYYVCSCGSTKERVELLVDMYDQAQQEIEDLDVFMDTKTLKELIDKQQSILEAINKAGRAIKVEW